MKPKNFTAAEKHFDKLATALRREKNKLLGRCNTLTADNKRKDERIAVLEAEVAQKDEWIERLLEYMKLEPESVQAAYEKDKAVERWAELMRLAGIYAGFGSSHV